MVTGDPPPGGPHENHEMRFMMPLIHAAAQRRKIQGGFNQGNAHEMGNTDGD
jgi:hypothetical protein